MIPFLCNGGPHASFRTNKSSGLTILGGDFNYTTEEGDRINLANAADAGRRDKPEQQHFQTILGDPFGLFELHQPSFTFATSNSRARLDRIYANFPVADQLDRHFRSSALEWRTDLSLHRAVRCSRSTPHHVNKDRAPISDNIIQDSDFPRRVVLEFENLRRQSTLR